LKFSGPSADFGLVTFADNIVLLARCKLGELIIEIAGRDHEAGIDG
jgi:hypothetical protein